MDSFRRRMASEMALNTASSRPSRDVALKIILPLIGCVVALGLVEVCFRMLMGQPKPKPHPNDLPKINYMPEQAFLTRDFYYPPVKADGTFRIIVIGDSFTFGGKVQFDDTFSKRLERMLNLNQSQRKVEVLNWGVPGYSTFQESKLFEDAVARFHPDLIVMEITLNDAEMKPFSVTHNFQNKDGSVKLNATIFKYWKSLGFVVSRVFNTILHQEYIKYHQKMFEDPENWNRFSASWKRMKELSDRHAVPMFAAIFPMLSHPLNQSYPFHEVHEKISKELGRRDIPSRDMFSDFEGRDPVRLQVEPGRDGHPNELAHRIAAESIYMGLVQERLLPEDVTIKRVLKQRWVKPTAVRDPQRDRKSMNPSSSKRKGEKKRTGNGSPTAK